MQNNVWIYDLGAVLKLYLDACLIILVDLLFR